MTNADTPLVRSLFGAYLINPISASSSMSCKASTRGTKHGVVITNYTDTAIILAAKNRAGAVTPVRFFV